MSRLLRYYKSAIRFIRFLSLLSLLTFCFFAGRITAAAVHTLTLHAAKSTVLQPAQGSWGLGYPNKGKAPVGNASIEELAKYNAFYAQDTEEKVLYLTFDCGYENGNTAAILDALKKHHAPATFFVVGPFLEAQPELVKRMVAEGHTVGNHTWHHPDMSAISTKEAFEKELSSVSELYEKIIGSPMPRYYRPPQGKYSTDNLQMAKALGYQTFFWSLAHVDWKQDAQPTKEQAFERLLGRVHPGAIVLLHCTSATNAQILDELLTRWEDMGYYFAPLSEISDPRTEHE
ncbi:MAG: polysaccharide deacetylase family protein [Eubacteriales bacterium]|nr:polysaccharide deacetylase family protein [Eubacteriales bacterium]